MDSNLNPLNFSAEFDLGSFDCEYCGVNYDQLRVNADFQGFTLTDQTGCYDWKTVTVTTPQDAENTLRDWACYYDVSQDDLDAFVAQVVEALNAYNAAMADA